MLKLTDKWSYSLDGATYTAVYDSKEAALKDAVMDAKSENYASFCVGRVMAFVPIVSAEDVVEQIGQSAYDDADEYSWGYLDDIKKCDMQKLEQMLTETFNKWAKETNNEPHFWMIEDVEEHSV